MYEIKFRSSFKGKDLETLIVVSIQTLKGNSKKCVKENVFPLVKESVEIEIMNL